MPSPEELRDITRRLAQELQLNDQERAIIDEQLAAVDSDVMRESVERARSDGLGPVNEVVRTIYETTAAEFAEHEYLR